MTGVHSNWSVSEPQQSSNIFSVSPGLNISFFFLNKFILFIYLFLAALGLCCCAWAFSSCVELGLRFVVVHGLLIVVASLAAEHTL